MIGQSLHSDDSFEYAQQHLGDDSFTAFTDVWRAMVALWHEQVHTSPAAVALRLGRPVDWLDRASTVPWSAFELAVDRVAALHRRNRLAIFGADLTRRALDVGEDEARIIADATAALEDAELSETDVSPATLTAFLALTVEYDWIVPGLLERGDRVLITGEEGGGKSVLTRQWALTMALGLDPANLARLAQPVRVLFVDCENSAAQTQRAFAKMLERTAHEPTDNLLVEIRTQGLDLLRAADQRWLTGCVAAAEPAVLATGPLYKLFVAADNDEGSARLVSQFLDRLRRRFGLVIIIEAHSPHGAAGDRAGLRPFGSSLWMRWPEFGFGLARRSKRDASKVEVVHWRGMRDTQRHFPTGLEWSTTGFPWRAT